MEKLCFLFKKYKEIIMYLIFGVLTTLVSLVCYSLFVELFRFSITVSSVFSWIIAVSFAFVTNKLFVFESKKKATVFREAIPFFIGRGITGAIDMFLPELLFAIGLRAELFGVKGLLAKIIVNIIVIILNYVFSKLFVFRKGE